MIQLLKLPCGIATTLLAAIYFNAHHVAAGPSVNVAMKAAFPSPPYLVELLESAAGENPESYFPLLDRVASGHFATASTDKDLYELFLETLKTDGLITSPEALSTFKLALSMRAAAPAIEAHYQYHETAVAPLLNETKENCDDWVLMDGKQYCSPALADAEATINGESQVRTLPFDRMLGKGPSAILYADITTPNFGAFHAKLADMARKGEISYRLRYRTANRKDATPLPVNGYGVELQLKRTDYIVIDDREAESQAGKSTASELVLDAEEEVADLKPLSNSELSSLGVKAASFIMQSEDQFEALLKLTQDFPKYSTSIAAHNESEAFLAEHYMNRGQIPGGMNVLWMNGVQLIERQMTPYTLIDMVRRERKLIQGVTELGFTGHEAVSMLGHREVTAAKTEDDARRFDWRDEIEEGKVIIWLNNIEKDKRYADFPTNMMALLQRVMPGQIPSVRRDMFNLIVPLDFTKPDDLYVVVEQLQNFIKRLLPIRFGLVPLTPTKEATEQAKIVYYLLENYGLSTLMAYLDAMYSGKHIKADQTQLDKITKDRALRAEAVALSLPEILESEHHARQIELANHWAERLAADGAVPPVFINGQAIPREKGWLQAMSVAIGGDLTMIQQGVYMGSIDDDLWIPGLFIHGEPTRRNTYIYPVNANDLTMMDIHKVHTDHMDLFGIIPVIEASEDSSKETWAALTVMADFSNNSGLQLLLSALEFRRSNPGTRLDLIHSPQNGDSGSKVNFALKKNLEKLLAAEGIDTLSSAINGNAEDDETPGFDKALDRFLTAADFSAGDQILILNGRKIGPIATDFHFKTEDFQQLLDFEQFSRIHPVYQAIGALNLTAKVTGPLAAAKITAITAMSTISDLPEGIFESAPTLRTTVYDDWESSHTMIQVGDSSTATVHIVAVLNPASEQGQKWAPILKVLSELDGVHLRIFLNPRDKIDELPVTRFYRYVLDSSPSFDAAGKVQSPSATFKGLPSEALLNLGMDVPPAWLVAAKESVQDLDNIKLSSVKSDIVATYELEHILIEGHSRDGQGNPPRGVQLLLGTEKDPHFADTIIMANIGYFQFKANPGYYNIQLKEGRSSDIFTIESVGAQGFNAVPGDEGTEVALMDFQGTTLYPRLIRKPGMEKEDVLEEPSSDTGNDLLSRGLKFAEGFLGGSRTKSKSVSAEEHADINIFSVASGHLYERMLNIMMVSVMKNTKHTVKFWFIEQFLSPSFKQFIPHLAAEYGFKYEMVTYKWPHWIRQQKEKQREIWGYKILFLDVLFPLSLDKVIFVDADQIVRTDMMDLVNLDLEGAPYGFTPMCDSRTEMEGFRFWKQGYWANYLRGLPYHISALYVVDLRRFREMAAGDRLRQTYHTLSADPNSLSNLDQDLPNHMQFQIPIHSLPQNWLWCETWCSDESQKEARTIDLCNNPQTKEPKLDRARRQVPEWTVYDDEIAALHRRIKLAAGETVKAAGETDANQKVLGGQQEDVVVDKNPKSRRFEEVPEPTERVKDEL